ncbi:hypothetical protein SAMN05421827_108138 [Pedobacter terrae]|uniref:Uncharacterized protein n=1 Tax=Pedobacter terrae TaxID=405671 RepID=A0A1G7VNL6_9SPHI|nr:hypothetical protein [Pedobacter terrae]SDG60480.1 hypothetical protein SAMN05421827_108138 [Pedobacter terrae]
MNKFSAGILLTVFPCFICINELGNASVLILFDAKKKEPFGGGEPRQDRGVWQKKSIIPQ